MIPLRDTNNRGLFPRQTAGLILINAAIFLSELLTHFNEGFLTHYGLVPQQVDWLLPASLLPLVSALFLHASLTHLLLNMWFLWIFGPNVERQLGNWYLPYYLVGGVIGNLVQYAALPGLEIPIVGASGAVAALLGFYFVHFSRHKIIALVPIFVILTAVRIPALVVLLLWFGLQFIGSLGEIASASSASIAYLAHIGGFAYGLAVGLAIGINQLWFRQRLGTANSISSLG